MSHAVSESVKLTPVSAVFHAACMVPSFGCSGGWSEMFAPAAAMTVVGIACVAVAVGSLGIVVGAAKEVVAVKVEAAPMAQPLIRRKQRAEVVICGAGRPGTTVDVAMNGRTAVARGDRPHGSVHEKSRSHRQPSR